MNTVSGKTQIYAILGEPIRHSMSPVIMNKNFTRKKLDKVFLALDANLETFGQIFPVLKQLGLSGYVFTMPVKEAALPYMEILSPEAQIIGAINCVVNDNGNLIGMNTDSIGFWNAVQEKNTNHLTIENAFILGVGGFARAAITQAALQGVKNIVVANRFSDVTFIESFNRFLSRLKQQAPGVTVELIDWQPIAWKPYLAKAELIANGTPNGMNSIGDLDSTFPFDAVRNDAIFFDAIYVPRITAFLKKAKEQGHITVEGINLLVHQGAVSFKNFTGDDVCPSIMKADILNFWKENMKGERK